MWFLACRRSGWLLGAFLVVGVPFAGCGSRTPLKVGAFCDTEGEARACEGICGVGRQSCQGGVYGACVIEPTERECSDACGVGVQSCVDEVWGECAVPPALRPCENNCGVGVEQCLDGAWGVCDVPVQVAGCEGECGPGVMECQEGVWGECQVEPVVRVCMTACGSGEETCRGGSWRNCTAPRPRPPKLLAVVRDFQDSHPDFESGRTGTDLGIVGEVLGPDDKPFIVGMPRTITSPETFNQWYNDVPGVNVSAEVPLQLAVAPGQSDLFVYQNNAFFPIDDILFGNQGRDHNFHFTLEISGEFRYIGGETFAFTGDDDLWVFINRRLAIDLGGLHRSLYGQVQLDEHAVVANMQPGNLYPIHIFFAERHTVESNFTIETSIAGPPECD